MGCFQKLIICLLFFCSVAVAQAEQSIEHGGRKIITFDVPQVEFRASKAGKLTKTFFSNTVGNGNLKITVTSKGWLNDTEAEKRFQDDKTLKRASQHSRLNDPIEIPGALKTLTYSTDSPFVGQAVVIYTKDFRCEFLVTGTGDAASEIDSTYAQLLKTLQIVPRTKISEVRIEK